MPAVAHRRNRRASTPIFGRRLLLLESVLIDSVASVKSALVAEWGTSLSSSFDPECVCFGLESLVEVVKGIVESTGLVILPKFLRSKSYYLQKLRF